MSGATYLKVDLVLTLELNLSVVDTPRQVHRSIDFDQCLVIEIEFTL